MGERQETQGLFADLPALKPDVILDLARQFRADTSGKKVDLGIGAYRTDAGKPYVLPVVKEAEERLVSQADYNHEYLPIEGYAPFNSASRALVFGTNHEAVQEERVATVQSLSGTGSLRVAFEFLRRQFPSPVVFIPDPTWGNHHNVVRDAGIKDARTYRYYNSVTGGLDFTGMCEDLEQAPMGSIIILHMCAHNPTGWDPTREQWRRLAEICQSRKHFPLFDNAYQGYATGSLEEDAYSVRHFADMGIQLMVACSFAKNMGLYGERVGALHVLCQSREEADKVIAHLKAIIRPMYSSPPCHYAKVAALILTDPELYLKWQEELTSMARRVIQMRQRLFAALVKNECPGSWGHVTEQIGMFSFTGLSAKQVRVLKSRYHIYMLDNGRASMCGLNEGNVEYVADAIKAVVTMEEENDERRS